MIKLWQTWKKWLSLQAHKMTTDFKKDLVDCIVVRLKAKEIYSHIIQVQGMLNRPQLVLAGSHIAKGDLT